MNTIKISRAKQGERRMIYYAHSSGLETSEWQTVKDHLMNTAQLTHMLSCDGCLAEFAAVAAMLHDLGKFSIPFQKRLEGQGPKIDHSTAGAQEILSLFNHDQGQEFISTLLAYCIAGHHGGLPDYGGPTDVPEDSTLSGRLKRKLPDYSAYRDELDLSEIRIPKTLPFRPNRNAPGFSLAFFTRIIYSLLVDADFQETESFMNKGKKPRGGYAGIDTLCDQFNLFIEKYFHPKTDIDQRRTSILKSCIAKAGEKPGLFTLTVPTGGGKTYSSMAFALNHAVQYGLQRIIYVIPYTSIIEQNAALFKECLGEENVLEHHSNFNLDNRYASQREEDFDEKTRLAADKLKLASENWDIPVVVTTSVQFFESLFSNRSSRCRKLHNLCKSVIIFDEAQMLPLKYLDPCMAAVDELVKNYGATAIFCTATQPALQRFFPAQTQFTELAPDPMALYNYFKRVLVVNVGKLADEDLVQQMNAFPQVLTIVNTRKHACGLFRGVLEEGRFHLSTLMCPAHRKEVIADIRDRLKTGQLCRVVSTQILEAGIDIDFPVGFRAVSGLDSIIQAAGRVNREGDRDRCNLYVFEPVSDLVKRIPAYIEQGAAVAKSVLRDYADGDPVCLAAIQEYYTLLYDLKDAQSFDKERILACFEKGVQEPNYDFRSAAEKFKLIEKDNQTVIIPYDSHAKALLQQVVKSEFPLRFSRSLQPYTVNIFAQEFEALSARGVIEVFNDTYFVLSESAYEQYYNQATGLLIPDQQGGEGIFFDGF